jgi:hypothetical protein
MIRNTIFIFLLLTICSCKIAKQSHCYEYVSQRPWCENYFERFTFTNDSMYFTRSIHMSSGVEIYKGKYIVSSNRIKALLYVGYTHNYRDSVFILDTDKSKGFTENDSIVNIRINLFENITGYEESYTEVRINNLKDNSFKNYYTDSNGSLVLSFNKNEGLKKRYIWIEHMGMKSGGFKMSLAGCENKTIFIYLGTSKYSHLYVEPYYKVRGKFKDDYLIINGSKYYKCKSKEK